MVDFRTNIKNCVRKNILLKKKWQKEQVYPKL